MRIDHVAHACDSPEETHRFYTEVLGLKLAQAYSGTELMLMYELPGGGNLVFSAAPGMSSIRTDHARWQREHVGLTVANRAEFDSWLRRLRKAGVAHELVNDERVYFSDPNGLVLELEVAEAPRSDSAAEDVLARWVNNQKRSAEPKGRN
jgi:catechol 2,3-dioxygenase-like lactoylglutathione lyase family enzyme